MIDRYLSGRVDRISPEAPVPVMQLGKEENRLGGAANVALNVKALGATPLLCGIVGDDANGVLLRQLVTARGLDESLIITDATRPTTVKTRLTASGQQLMRVDRESTDHVTGSAAQSLHATFADTLATGTVDLVLFQDYNKGALHPTITAELLSACRAADVPTVVDPKNKGFWSFKGCTLFKPNLREIQQQVDFTIVPTVASLDRAAKEIFGRLGCQSVMITLSEHGIYTHDGTTSRIFATDAKDIADVSGAGDTVISVAACGLAAGMPLDDIARLSNLAGAQVIAKRGVVAVDLAALLQAAQD